MVMEKAMPWQCCATSGCCAAAVKDAPAALLNISLSGFMNDEESACVFVSRARALVESATLQHCTTVCDATVAVAADG
jgi:hypothetical protein